MSSVVTAVRREIFSSIKCARPLFNFFTMLYDLDMRGRNISDQTSDSELTVLDPSAAVGAAPTVGANARFRRQIRVLIGSAGGLASHARGLARQHDTILNCTENVSDREK